MTQESYRARGGDKDSQDKDIAKAKKLASELEW
jgi:hypothetical protein